MALWLATDRNFIPIKLEHYSRNVGSSQMPYSISRSDDFRRIAPGLWYPFRSTWTSLDHWQDRAGRGIGVAGRRVYEVESVTLAPKVNPALFRDVVFPAGTQVEVSDEQGNHVGGYDQEKEGVAEITPARYQSLLSQAKDRDAQRKARAARETTSAKLKGVCDS